MKLTISTLCLTLISSISAIVGAQTLPPTVAKPPRVQLQIERPRIDVAFVVDATGSMSDEIDVIKKEVWRIANELLAGKPSPDIRFGLVLYKDRQDDFLFRTTELTRDIDRIHRELMSISVDGGGDNPEDVGRGLHAAMGLDWDLRKSVTRLTYLVGDAPGHNYSDGFGINSATAHALQRNIKIHTIGCSGIDGDGGRQQFASIARQTGGEFDALTYYAEVQADDGTKRSVVYYDGGVYAAEEALSEAELSEGGEALLRKKKLKRADAKTRAKGRAAPKKNNLDGLMQRSVKESAEKMGVAY
jgi:Mg-chelatase subunit ChlD